jgi:predicted nucleic acid-binding protein
VVITEILQGVTTQRQADELLVDLGALHYLEISRNAYIQAATIYRLCRNKGLTIRKPIDCIIAATCLEHSAFLLHNDRDFEHIAKHFPLQSM